LFAQLIGL